MVDACFADGQKLLDQLILDGFPVDGACWIKADDDSPWTFYLASRLASRAGPREVFQRIQASLKKLEEVRLRLSQITPIDEEHPIAKGLGPILKGLSRLKGARAGHWGGQYIGTVPIKDAYIYPESSYQGAGVNPMTEYQVIDETIRLMRTSREGDFSSVILKDGQSFQGVPVGVELIDGAMVVKFLEAPSHAPRIYPASEISTIHCGA